MTVYVDRSGPPGSAVLATAAQLGQPVGDMPFVSGLFSRFGEWARVDSRAEGRFMERFEPGAFARTIRENRSRIRIIYDHGQDGFINRRPIAPLDILGEDVRGGYFAGRLFDTVAGRELIPLLAAGVLGSSFRFGAIRQRSEDRPMRSDHNPERLPERTILEADLIEVGPTPFPVYAGSTAGLSTGEHPAPRSSKFPPMSTDEFVRRLTMPSRGTADRQAIDAWLDSVMPLSSGRR
jgi:HK97 family phage prohead protease